MTTVPLCRCRVLYVGSSVPTITKDGLQGIQQPLRERYPVNENSETKGIDSWLSVWSNGILVEYIEGAKKTETAFYPITNLHYCAAVRYVNVTGFAVEGGGERFLPLDTPLANPPNSPHPPIFAAIFRRTTGVKVLECHAFICTNEKAANALVRCCFHSYADTISLKMEDKIPGLKAIKEASRSATPSSDQNMSETANNEDISKDETDWNERAIGQKSWQRRQQSGEYDSASLSFSLKQGTKKSKKGKRNSENEGMLVPYEGHNRSEQGGEIYDTHHNGMMHDRAFMMPPYFMPPPGAPFRRGSGGSMPMPPHGFAAFRPPPPGMMPPPHMMPPPPFLMRPGMRMMPPPPPHMAARFGWPPPPFMPPPHGARFGFMPPPHPHFRPYFYMPPYMMDRPKTPNDGGPIITSAESVYDTYPRHHGGGGNYEEPIYMPTNNGGGGGPPHSSYKPSSPDNHEGGGYYETYRRLPQDKKHTSRSESDVSGDENQHYWDAYEARIYRQPHLNEKAFSETLAARSPKLKKDNSPTPADPNTLVQQQQQPSSSKKIVTETTTATNGSTTPRPQTPPADYDLNELHINDQHRLQQHHHKQGSSQQNQNQRAAIL